MTEPNNISFRDTAARVVKKGDGYYRYIFFEYKNEYDHLMNSGLYLELIQKKLLIEHQEVDTDTNLRNVYKTLYPKQIEFQSYPFEWSYTQWRKVIRTYLKINLIALKYGMILKDATPYNFYLLGGNPIMFDTSSFMFFKENDRWIAYRQFCEELLSPIALMHHNGAQWSKLTIANLKGLPLNFVSRQLPLKSWLNLTTLLHIHLHSKYYRDSKKIENDQKIKKGFSLETIILLNEMIFKTIGKWNRPYKYNNNWDSYYETDIQSSKYLNHKEKTLRKWLEFIKPKSVIDLGANTGKFSFISAEYAEKVIAIESDENCVDIIENTISLKKNNNIYTLIGELAEPTPKMGLLHQERESIYERGKAELALGLALTHHLHITNKLSFRQIAELFNKFSSKYVVMEFIGKDDKKVKLLSKNIKINFDDYSEEKCVLSMEKYFTIADREPLVDSQRVLYLFKK